MAADSRLGAWGAASVLSAAARTAVLVTGMLALVPSGGCAKCCPPHTKPPSGTPVDEVVQEFPAGTAMQTAWRVRFAHATGKGLYITGAWFKRGPTDPWMRVLWDARLADIFVPYHPGSPRFFDLTQFNFSLVPASQADAGKCGTVIDGVIVKEVRDRGVAWKDDTAVRRGQELVLWATLDAANYNYVMQYVFRDDGMISFRLGATSRNLPGMESVAHMHNGLWRVDVDLDGASHDSAMLMKHKEQITGPTATDSTVPFNGGKEGFADWNPLEFTELMVADTQKTNGRRHHVSYDLMPLRPGTARHQEAFAHHDFWVTRYHPGDLFYDQLPNYVSNGEPVTDTDVVLWYLSPMHHLPRDEDGEKQSGVWKGVALIMWSGFDLRPRNLFDRTPLFP